MSGCDTTSAVFNQDKIKFVQTLKENPGLHNIILIWFKDPDAIPEAFADTGKHFLAALYGYVEVDASY